MRRAVVADRRRSRWLVAMASTLAVATGIASPAIAADRTIHVAASGSDGANGQAGSPVRTINRALSLAASVNATAIRVGAGSFPRVTDTRVRRDWIAIRGATSAPTKVSGAKLAGASKLQFANIDFTRDVKTEVSKRQRRASDIQFTKSNFAAGPKQTCLALKQVDRVSVLSSTLQGCRTGIVLVNVTEARIAGNRMRRFAQDGMILSRVSDSVISRNSIEEVRDPDRQAHNDAFQITGNVERLVVDSNEFSGSKHQLIMVQSNKGPNRGLVFQNNLLHGAGAYAVQFEHATEVVFVHNTVWDSALGVTLRNRGKDPAKATHDTVVVNNILQGFSTREGTTTASMSNNFIYDSTAKGFRQDGSNYRGENPGFVSDDDFHLKGSSRLREAGDPARRTEYDLDAQRRPVRPSVGAYEPSAQSQSKPPTFRSGIAIPPPPTQVDGEDPATGVTLPGTPAPPTVPGLPSLEDLGLGLPSLGQVAPIPAPSPVEIPTEVEQEPVAIPTLPR